MGEWVSLIRLFRLKFCRNTRQICKEGICKKAGGSVDGSRSYSFRRSTAIFPEPPLPFFCISKDPDFNLIISYEYG